jgi:MATE family multidrug resistance protein
MENARASHPFRRAPHATLVRLSLPVLVSLAAEPITGAVDTAFVARLGAPSLAALGVGATLLSGVFWMFNFLGVGTQTEVAQRLGRQAQEEAAAIGTLAMVLALILGLGLLILGYGLIPAAVDFMDASGRVRTEALQYIRMRLFGAPAVVVTLAAFGILRGRQDMTAPLKIAAGLNLMNIVLDAGLIFGIGPLPALGIRGAALASAISQWAGALWAVAAVHASVGIRFRFEAADLRRLLHIGGDMFLRTGLLTAFLVLTTRAATQIGNEAGAAHQAIRQVWVLTALLLDAFAISGQSLVGYFLGCDERRQARRVAGVVCLWSFGAGLLLAIGMALSTRWVALAMVPASARALFPAAWLAALLFQPINAFAFATDGIHWGSGDFRYLRNAMLGASAAGALAVLLLDTTHPDALARLWVITGGWVTLRALFGILRVWPGVGATPLAIEAPSPPTR